MEKNTVSFNKSSGAFVKLLDIPPHRSGLLSGLTFGVKDLIDIAFEKTGGGNASWEQAHAPAQVHAICVEQLLQAGARCLGKTVSDELAFSLLGENHFYGTPLNIFVESS
jgi:amidase